MEQPVGGGFCGKSLGNAGARGGAQSSIGSVSVPVAAHGLPDSLSSTMIVWRGGGCVGESLGNGGRRAGAGSGAAIAGCRPGAEGGVSASRGA